MMRHLRAYHRAGTIGEARQIKGEYGDRAAYLAGGSDLLVHQPPAVEALIDIRHAGIDYVRRDDGEFAVGGAALLCHAESALSEVAGGMLKTALRNTAPWLVRNSATVAGNIANASPAADSIPALMALDAHLVLYGDAEERVGIEDVLIGPHQTSLGDRLIEEIRIPDGAGPRSAGFIKLARSKSDIAQVNVAVSFVRDGEALRDVRIALGAVAPTPVRARAAEALLEGQRPSKYVLAEVERAVQQAVQPIDDWRASAGYRRRMSGVLARRAIRQALGEGEQGVSE